MKHIFIKGEDSTRPTLLLLHGTGGNEHDLVGLGKEIDAAANILSVRGNVLRKRYATIFQTFSRRCI